MIELTTLVMKAAKLAEFVPKQKNELTNVMIGAFHLLIRC